jgi:hypothetical protein
VNPSPRDRASVLNALVDTAERFVTNRDHGVTAEDLTGLRADLERVSVHREGPLVVTELQRLLLVVLEMVHRRQRDGDWLHGYMRRRLLSLAGELLPDAREAFGRALDARQRGYG